MTRFMGVTSSIFFFVPHTLDNIPGKEARGTIASVGRLINEYILYYASTAQVVRLIYNSFI